MLFKCFLGLSAEELPPDHSTLCRFRLRLGAEGFQRLFNQTVEQARSQGLVSDRLHIIDATHMTAKVDLFRLKKEHRHGDDDDHYVDRNSPDPDARFGRKTPKKGFYGYKCHVVEDANSEFIVQVLTTSGNVPDGSALPALAQPQAQELTGDKAYDSKSNRSHLEALGECKQFYGLRRARYWGLGKVAIQTLMVALVVNLKRWVTLLKLRSPACSWASVA